VDHTLPLLIKRECFLSHIWRRHFRRAKSDDPPRTRRLVLPFSISIRCSPARPLSLPPPPREGGSRNFEKGQMSRPSSAPLVLQSRSRCHCVTVRAVYAANALVILQAAFCWKNACRLAEELASSTTSTRYPIARLIPTGASRFVLSVQRSSRVDADPRSSRVRA